MAGGFSLQPDQTRLLFGSASIPVRCWLEYFSVGTTLQRFSERQVMLESSEERRTLPSGKCWEEIFLVRGELDYKGNVCSDTYLCLPPEGLAPACCAAASGAVILRLMFGSEPSHDVTLQGTVQGKPASEVVDFARLTWNEIPARRANDPAARIVELAANATRTRITSLMDCRAGWVLDDHDHPSDVLTFCVRGGGRLGIEDQSSPYRDGQLVAIPAGVRHRFETGPEGAFLLVFVFEPFLSGGALRFGVPLEGCS